MLYTLVFSSSFGASRADPGTLGTLDLTLSSRLATRVIEKITLEWYLGDGATGASCIASNNASWTFDPRTLVS